MAPPSPPVTPMETSMCGRLPAERPFSSTGGIRGPLMHWHGLLMGRKSPRQARTVPSMYGNPVSRKRHKTMILHNDAGRYNMYNMGAKTSTPPRGRSTTARPTTQSPEQRPKRNARWKLLLLLLAGALVISTVLIVANLLRASITLAVQVAGQPAVQVDLNQSFALSSYLL